MHIYTHKHSHRHVCLWGEIIGRIYSRGLNSVVHGPSQHFIIERFCNIKIKLSSSSVKSEAVSSLDPFFPGQLSAGAEEMLFIKGVWVLGLPQAPT